MMGLALAVIPHLTVAEPDPGSATNVWGAVAAIASGVAVVVGAIIRDRRSKAPSEVVREDVPDAADNARILTDIARGMVEDIAKRLEIVEHELAAERAERSNQQRIWRAFAHSVEVWISQTQEAARIAGITLPPPPESPMEH